jgi:hypothetical protein
MFEQHPVWAEDETERLVPVTDLDPLPSHLGNLYVRVEFVTPSGVRLTGCVSAGSRHFAAVFVHDAAFYFNSRIAPLESEIEELNRLVPELRGVIFPLRYESAFYFADEPSRIDGSFSAPP